MFIISVNMDMESQTELVTKNALKEKLQSWSNTSLTEILHTKIVYKAELLGPIHFICN
jgi:hypothetical protein